ncbi:MAG: autotransporter domain-containing protein [Rhodospirillaceae bacterium]
MTVKKRFRIGISYVSLAVCGSLATPAVQAGDAVISTARTSPAATSRADGTAPGNLTIAPEGSIKVGTGPAVTVDSSHTFTNNGAVEVTAERGSTGVLVTTAGGAITGNVVDNGTISVPGPTSSSSPLWPEYVFNTGIEVSGANAFNGSITRGAGSALTAGGNGATGIGILTTMSGALTTDGTIRVARQDSFGVKATGAIGSFSNGGAIEATGQDAIGVYIGAGSAGEIVNRGSIVTGSPATTNAAGETVPAVRGGRALWIAGNSGAISIAGNGLTKEQETLALPPEGALPDASLSVRGNGEALFIGQGGLSGNRDITVNGQTGSATPSSIVNRGVVLTESALRSTTPVRAVNITGLTVGSTVYRTTLVGGISNEGGDINALGRDSTAQAIRIGDFASVPSLHNSGAILARGVDSGENADTGALGSGGGDAYGVIIEQSGRLSSLTNNGKITADARGAVFSAYGIVDLSGTLTSLDNRGNIIAARRGSGIAVAFDLSRAPGATVRNSGTMSGNMLFGAGADSYLSTAGVLLGDLNMGAGNDTVSLADTTLTGAVNLGDGAHTVTFTSSTLEGGLTLGAGTAEVDVNGTTIRIPNTSEVRFTNGRIRGGSTVSFSINAQDETVGGIRAAGNLVVDAGTTLNTTITGAVVDQFTVNLIEAGSLTMNADLGGLQPGSTVMYQREIKLAPDNRNVLQYQITRRTAAQLGLAPSLGLIYDGVVESLGADTELSGVMAAFTEQPKFEAALSAMVPDVSDAARRSALTSRALAQSAIQRRLSGFPGNRNDPLGRFRSGFWLQSLTNFGSADDEAGVPGYSLFAQGVAGGIDAILGDQTIVGFSLTQTFGSAEERNRATDAVKLSTTSLDLYARANADFGYIQGTIGYGINKYRNNRTVEVESVRRNTGASSPGYQWGAMVDAGSSWVAGSTILTGYVRAAYHNVYRHAYEEEGGGPAIDLRYNSTSYDSIRAGGGVQVERRIQFSASNALALNLHGDYAHEFNDEATRVRARFVAGTNAFELRGMTPAKNILSGGVGAAWERRLSTTSLDYDVEKAGPWLGHRVTLTYRQRF